MNAQREGMYFVNSHQASVLADEPGAGKCLFDKALCEINGIVMSMEEIWDRFSTAAEYYDGGYWSTPSNHMTTSSIDDNGKLVAGNVSSLYRERFTGQLRKIKTSNGKTIITTKIHQFLTDHGWDNSIVVGDFICSPI